MRLIRTISILSLSFCAATIYATPASSQTNLFAKCMEVEEAIKYAFNGVRSENLTYSLRKGNQTFLVLMISKIDAEKGETKKGYFAPWRLIERQGESLTYCLVAAGEYVQPLMSLHYSNPKKKYGMPGSGHQRCSDGRDVMDGVDIRMWANRELGESFVIHLDSDVGRKDFTFLMSRESIWILIDGEKGNPSEACYYSRGDNLNSHRNLKIGPSR